jgi:crotonobetainyl-CoA:carnitine CoA-transferase CaiB-like acyl-CoA transferase
LELKSQKGNSDWCSLAAALAAWMKTQSVADVERDFAKVGIPAAAVRTYAAAAANPHVIERDMLQQLSKKTARPCL